MQVFVIHDKLDDSNLKVVYYPTEIMWADILTKLNKEALSA
jgi:hypothetical protein